MNEASLVACKTVMFGNYVQIRDSIVCVGSVIESEGIPPILRRWIIWHISLASIAFRDRELWNEASAIAPKVVCARENGAMPIEGDASGRNWKEFLRAHTIERVAIEHRYCSVERKTAIVRCICGLSNYTVIPTIQDARFLGPESRSINWWVPIPRQISLRSESPSLCIFVELLAIHTKQKAWCNMDRCVLLGIRLQVFLSRVWCALRRRSSSRRFLLGV
jgi:hypothetical protein